MVRVELYGIPRLEAGTTAVEVAASNVGEALKALGIRLPALVPDVVEPDGALSPHYLVAVDGGDLTRDLARPLRPGDVLVLVSAHAGG